MKRPRYAIPTFFWYVNAAIIVGMVAVLGFLGGSALQLRTLLPEQVRLRGYQPPLATEVYSTERHSDGTVTHTLLARVYKEDREYIPLAKIPRQLVEATVALEDRRFYTHRGISPRDIVRAAWVDLAGQRVIQGASTITQQLVRNIWLTHERTWERKIREILLALELERNFSKDEILEMYLNEVYYGHGAYGVRTAARTFFSKSPEELTLAECALLAGLPQRPSGHDPFSHPERAKARRAEALEAMQRDGLITAEERREAARASLVAEEAGKLPAGVVVSRAPHFSHLVIRLLTQRYGADVVYSGGLRVYTSLDMRVQEAAQKALDEGVKSLRSTGRIKGGLVGQGALACVDVHDGRVLAMVGGVGPFEEVQFNRAHPGPTVYGRQTGSAFKPYVWTRALEAGFGPNSTVSGGPITIPTGGGRSWSPKNYSPRQGGMWTLRAGLAMSVNLVSVRLIREVGVDSVRSTAARIMNIPTSRLDPYLSLSLGVSNISPLEMASGYAVFARGGLRYDRAFILRVDDYWGRPLYRAPLTPTRVLSPEIANSMTSMMRSVVTSGTGTRAAAVGYPAAGKTGTTQDGRDAWWVGYTPDLSAAVWVGNDDYKPCPRATGGGFCAPIWVRFMREAMKILDYDGQFPAGAGVVATRRPQQEPREERERPEEEQTSRSVTLCAESGRRATAYCPSTYEKTLSPGESTPGACTVHRAPRAAEPTAPAPASPPEPEPAPTPPTGGETTRANVCTASGRLATPFCPSTEERSFPAGQTPGKCTMHGGE